jgi:hypothetical protein
MQEIYSEVYRGCAVKLVVDEDPPNPRELFSNVGTMVCSHKHYTLGDEETKNVDIELLTEGAMVLPMYMYDHSGITISTKPFNCPWDSGQIGIIFCRLETALNTFQLPAGSTWQSMCVSEQNEKLDLSTAVKQAMEHEVKLYDDYLNNNAVGFLANSLGEDGNETIESVWGFYPNYQVPVKNQWDYVIDQARDSINIWLADQQVLQTDMCANI